MTFFIIIYAIFPILGIWYTFECFWLVFNSCERMSKQKFLIQMFRRSAHIIKFCLLSNWINFTRAKIIRDIQHVKVFLYWCIFSNWVGIPSVMYACQGAGHLNIWDYMVSNATGLSKWQQSMFQVFSYLDLAHAQFPKNCSPRIDMEVWSEKSHVHFS